MSKCIKCGVPVTSGMVIHSECYEALKENAKEGEVISQLRQEDFFNRCYDTLREYRDELEASRSYLRLEDELDSVQMKIAEVSALMQTLLDFFQASEGEGQL